MKISIIGYGFVGKAMSKLFSQSIIYDPGYPETQASKNEINTCDVSFVCVPTNILPDGSCDISIVEETLTWLKTPLIIIRSTIQPGTTDHLKKLYPEKHIIFQPEYIGETTAHPMIDESSRNFLIFGGTQPDCAKAVEIYQSVYNSSVKILFLKPIEAEIVKYMENTAIASMVTLANEYYNICHIFGADYNMVREAFLLDPRMSRYFTFVYPEKRGFEGKCLPKDLNAIIKSSENAGYTPKFIKDILENNDRIRSK
jgi:UDPglucose 6-dehydrogenase